MPFLLEIPYLFYKPKIQTFGATKHVGSKPRGEESACEISCAVICAQLILTWRRLTVAKKASAADGVTAFAGIVEARKVLDKVEQLIKTDKYDDAKTLLESGSVAAFESNAMALVASPALAAEDKKAIGTIRRYGVGADVLIMLGGLNEAVRDDDARAAKSYLAKSKASLDEVISIARGSGL